MTDNSSNTFLFYNNTSETFNVWEMGNGRREPGKEVRNGRREMRVSKNRKIPVIESNYFTTEDTENTEVSMVFLRFFSGFSPVFLRLSSANSTVKKHLFDIGSYTGGQGRNCESHRKKILGKLNSGKPNVRFDEGELEIEDCHYTSSQLYPFSIASIFYR
ncbi:MAG: hypothetical protein K8T10_08350 [Candidatus Eremiobacteraeota bacterium]|nr:hypothetical protein [Candidatus Eremiobacteraeota bacterium]